MRFAELDLHPGLLEGVAALGFERPTPIQGDVIPPALKGRDILASAETGSGKTVAFLLPVLHHLLTAAERGSRALVLAPTRELAAQVAEQAQALARFTHLRTATIHGGVAMGPQVRAIRDDVEVLVATPGRLLDLLRRTPVALQRFELLVLDEADRMLDMGFLPDVQEILALLPSRRQTFFLSATIPAEIAELCRRLLCDPVSIDVDTPAAPACGVRQAVYPVPEELKQQLLVELLAPAEIRNVLVFTRTKHRANRLAHYLESRGIRAERLHGNRTQAQRTQALRNFQEGKTRVLVATNVAARGIDIRELSHVINYDVPAVPDDYIHRVGRTARAQRTGDALTLVAPHEELDLAAIEEALGCPLPRLELPRFDYNARAEDRLELPYPERRAAARAVRGRRRKVRAPAEQRSASRGAREGESSSPRVPSTGTFRPRQRRARGRLDDVDGNIAGTHELSHLDFLNGSASLRGSDPRSTDGQQPRRAPGRVAEADVGPSAAASEETAGGKASRRLRPRKTRDRSGDDELEPVIPAEHDLPPRQPGQPRRPSHQPAALSLSGRRYLVVRDEDESE